MTTVIAPDKGQFVVLWSPESAEHDPNYCELGRFSTRAKAQAFLAAG